MADNEVLREAWGNYLGAKSSISKKIRDVLDLHYYKQLKEKTVE